METRQCSPVVSAPSGIVTFLFTDVEGSTMRWERDGRAMAAALARHDELVRAALVAHGGHVFKTAGDAFCAAFADPANAAAAALETQQRLAAEDFSAVDGLRVRIALHTGTAHERDGDYFGSAVNRVARIMALGHGGQILVSSATAALLSADERYRDALHDLGEHVLRDLVAPERISQLACAGGPASFPPLRTAAAATHNLPLQISSFVGREDDIAAIRELLRERRGVTLTGTGGIGKTRCALEVALAMLADYKDGVRYVELASLEDPLSVASAVAAALDLRESTHEPILVTLKRALAGRRMLIVLDNCEHVVDAAARFTQTLLGSAPNVSILATSREPLAYTGEGLYRMPSLAMPAPGVRLTANEAERFSAIALFAIRAKASNAQFELTDENAATVASIVRKLDGIALALELAATRLRTMSVAELAERLDKQLQLLTTGSRTASVRQRTMRGLIDWSWELLTPQERAVFARLCLFASRFSIGAAQALCADDMADLDVGDVVASLVDKSVVTADVAPQTDDDSGFRIVEALREYGLEKLAASGDAPRAHAGLLAWSVALANEADAAWETMPSQRWEDRFGPQLDNVRAALHWALEERNDVRAGAHLCGRLARLFGRLAPFEGRRWTQLALAEDDGTDPQLTAELKLAEATVHVPLREKSVVIDAAREALAAFEALGDEVGAARAEVCLGFTLAVSGDPAAGKPYLRQALALFRKRGLEQSAAIAAQDLATAHLCADEDRDAQRYFEEALTGFQNLGNVRGIVDVSINLAELAYRLGRVDAALALAFDAAETPTTDTDPAVLMNLSAYLIAAGRFQEALEYARASLERVRASSDAANMAIVAQHFAAVAALRPEDDSEQKMRSRIRAAALCGACDQRLTEIGGIREFTEQREYDRLIAALTEELDQNALESARSDGCSWTDRRIVSEALAI
jgi:predicted ATPase/class 3 adenylate cyclase